MGSGMYSAISGDIAKMESLETYTNNITNLNTFGFKKDRIVFESYLSDYDQNRNNKGINLVHLRQSFVDFTPGTHQPTGGSFDFAIEGEGFFKVKKDGKELYTRLGQFKRTEAGTLMFGDYEVLSADGKPIIIPNAAVDINEKGEILDNGSSVGQLALFDIKNKSLLQKQGGSMFKLPAGQETTPVTEPKLIRGNLETSNVNLMQEMALMMDGLRAFEAYQKVLKTYSKINGHASEIGSL